MLEIKNITKIYKLKNHEVKALDNINFTINNNEFIAITGASGSGKTSLMNIIGALDSDFDGDVIINNKSLKQANNKDLDSYRKNAIGFIFQHFTLINSLNSLENVELALDISNVKKSIKKEKALSLLKRVDMQEHVKKKVNVLSGGQKQRVAIARALANNPDIILADEPTGALDSKNSIQVMELLKELSNDRLVVMVTHNDDLAIKYATKIIKMEDGKIIEVIDNNPCSNNAMSNVSIKTKSNMKFRKAITLALRNLNLKKFRTLFTAIGMSIGIVGIALSLALSTGTKEVVKNQVYSVFPANKVFSTYADEFEKGLTEQTNQLKYSDFQEIKKIANKADSSFFMVANYSTSLFSLNKESANPKNLVNTNNGDTEKKRDYIFLMPTMINQIDSLMSNIGFGSKGNKNNSYDIVLSLSTAKELLGDDKKDVKTLINKKVYLAVIDVEKASLTSSSDANKTVEFTIVGITSDNTLLPVIYVNDNFIQSILKDYFNVKIEDTKASFASLTFNNGNVEEIVKEMNNSQSKYHFEQAASTIISTVNSVLDIVRDGLIAFSSVSVIVAILMIGIVVYISVIERKQEIGIIRAIGGKTKDIRNIFVCEAIIIGMLAGIIGVCIAKGLTYVINAAVQSALSSSFQNIPNLNPAILDGQTMIILVAICTLLSIVAGIIPAIKAAHLDPIDAIRKKG